MSEETTENGQKICAEKKKQKSKMDFDSLYEQLQIDNPTLIANKRFWTRKGNSQKYTCSLCNISIQISTNLNVLKTTILNHVEDKYHKKRFTVNLSKESTTEENSHCETSRTNEKELLSIRNLKICSDFDSVYCSFEKSNPVVKSSRAFITKKEDGRYFLCTLCEVMIFNSVDANEFKYNLWVHLNDNQHRERLPNFSEIQKAFRKVIENFSKAVPNRFEYDLQFFEIGPVFRFIKCSLCEVAVSSNLHRLENHVRGDEHTERKNLFSKKGIKKEIPHDHTRNAFRKFVVKLEEPFKKDVKYIQIGKIPGYVVCTLCTYVILPTQFYVQTHLESAVHKKNKAETALFGPPKRRMTLEELMSTLPEDLRDYNIFREDMCGLTCQRCKVCIPATSYDLYSHITKERLAVLN